VCVCVVIFHNLNTTIYLSTVPYVYIIKYNNNNNNNNNNKIFALD
jgi:hypothetical protein